jgi:hypothetical protein
MLLWSWSCIKNPWRKRELMCKPSYKNFLGMMVKTRNLLCSRVSGALKLTAWQWNIWSASAVASAVSFLGYSLISRQRGCITTGLYRRLGQKDVLPVDQWIEIVCIHCIKDIADGFQPRFSSIVCYKISWTRWTDLCWRGLHQFDLTSDGGQSAETLTAICYWTRYLRRSN